MNPRLTERGRLLLLVGLAALALLWRAGLVGGRIVGDIADDGPNRGANAALLRNYYQLVTAAPGPAGSGVLADRLIPGRTTPPRVRLMESEAVRMTPGFLRNEFVPGAELMDGSVRVRINRWGQRDRDYDQQKPPGTIRIALLGASNEMGWGVEQDRIYDNVLEERLNRELGGPGRPRYEVINFSMAGHSLVEMLYLAETKVLAFQPDLILVTFTVHDVREVVLGQLADRVRSGRELHYDFLSKVVAQAGGTPGDSAPRLMRKYTPYWRTIVDGCFSGFAELARARQVPVAISLLRLELRPGLEPELDWGLEAARRHGLIALPVFHGMTMAHGSPDQMYLDPFLDRHPTARGHALIADDLFNLLTTHERVGPLLRGAGKGESKP
jgi:hypothetical protein